MWRHPTSVRMGKASANTAVAIHRAFEPRRARFTAMEAIIVRGAGRDQGAAPPPPAGGAPRQVWRLNQTLPGPSYERPSPQVPIDLPRFVRHAALREVKSPRRVAGSQAQVTVTLLSG